MAAKTERRGSVMSAVIITMLAAAVVVLAIRSIPASVRPSFAPTPTVTARP